MIMVVRIMHIITTLEQGGAENMLFKLISKSACDPHYQHMVVSLTGKGVFGPLLEQCGVHVYNASIKARFSDLAQICRLIAKVRHFQPHVIQTWLYHADILGTLIYPFSKRSKLVWNLRCANMDFDEYAWTTGMIFKILKILSGIPSVICANSKAGIMVHRQKGYHPKQWVWIPNGFDTYKFKPCPKNSSFRESLNMPLSSPVVGMVARFDPMKDFETFFQAAGIIKKIQNNVHFVLIGNEVDSGNKILRDLTEKHQLAGNVHLLGRRNDVDQIYPEMDIFTLASSFGEGFPNVIGEAMACGIPCVATDVGDSRRIIGETGIIVPARDPDRLAGAWLDLLNAPENMRKQLGKDARRRILDNYRMELIQEKYLSLYNLLAAH